MTAANRIHPSWLLFVLAVAALAALGGAAEASAIGTASVSGNTLVYQGDGATEHASIDKEPVRDDTGATVGAFLEVVDRRRGGRVTGVSPCVTEGVGANCPLGSSILQVRLGGGDDSFESQDRTLGFRPGSNCLALQSFAPLRLDGGPGRDLVNGSRLADTMAGGTGDDGVYGWDGNDHLKGGTGVDLLLGHDGNDVLEGGSGNDVIHLGADPEDKDSCFRASGKAYKDIGRGGRGNDAISANSGRNRIEGGPGNDELGGGVGTGRDTILGGSGRDTIWSRDGRRDRVNCGSGRDLLEASDRKDRVVGCEKRFLRPR